MVKGSKIKPFLWFEHQAEEAARFYTSIFRDSKLGAIARYPEGSPGPAGQVMTVAFRIEGQDFVGAERFFDDANRARRVMPALLKMVKLDIRQLEEAAR